MRHTSTTSTKETRRLSTSIAAKTSDFKNPKFKAYIEAHQKELMDRLYKACIDEDRQLPEYVAYAESVLIDQPMEDHFGWFEDIVGTVINVLREMNLERLAEEKEKSVTGFLAGQFKGSLSYEFKDWCIEHESEILTEVRKKFNYYDFDNVEMVEKRPIIDRVLEGDPVDNVRKSFFLDIAGTLYGVIKEKKAAFDRGELKNDPEPAVAERNHPKRGGVDIYAWAEQYPGADYYDQSTGYIYRCGDYTRAKKFGLPTPGIAVVDSFTGQLIGYAQK